MVCRGYGFPTQPWVSGMWRCGSRRRISSFRQMDLPRNTKTSFLESIFWSARAAAILNATGLGLCFGGPDQFRRVLQGFRGEFVTAEHAAHFFRAVRGREVRSEERR